MPFYGQHLWSGGKSVVITEGEIDCLSVAQSFDCRWAVVSLPNGAQSAARVVKAQYEWLDTFEKIVLCFDQDTDGRKAAADVCQVLPPGKAYVMTLPLKDANEVLLEQGPAAITQCFWNASPWRPDGIRKLSDLREQAKAPITIGLPWAFQSLTRGTFGRREGELYAFGAGTGVGKTDIFTQQIEYDVSTLKLPVGVFFLEQDNVETIRRLAGKLMSKPFHIPDTGLWEQGDYEAAVDLLADTDLVYLYDHFGQTHWDTIKSRIRYLAVNHGVKLIYLDHLTALADPSNERGSLEKIMAEMAGLTKELGLICHVISHLSTPGHGKPHEAGGKVELMHFKGARAIGFWPSYAFGLERDKTHEDRELRNVTTVRCLKDRYTGQYDGEVFHIKYDPQTTRLTETAIEFNQEPAEDADAPF
jgi:twinkle protein